MSCPTRFISVMRQSLFSLFSKINMFLYGRKQIIMEEESISPLSPEKLRGPHLVLPKDLSVPPGGL